MSSDPKKPFDAPPPGTPDLLQKELQLDRRRRVPTFEELQADAPTNPAQRALARPPAPAAPRAPAPITAEPTRAAPTLGAAAAPTTQHVSPQQAAEAWNAEQARLRAAAQARAQALAQQQAEAARAQAQARAAAQAQAQQQAAAAIDVADGGEVPTRVSGQTQAMQQAALLQAQAAARAAALARQQAAATQSRPLPPSAAAPAPAPVAARAPENFDDRGDEPATRVNPKMQAIPAARPQPAPAPAPAVTTVEQALQRPVESAPSPRASAPQLAPRDQPPSPAAFAQARAALQPVPPPPAAKGAVAPEGAQVPPARAAVVPAAPAAPVAPSAPPPPEEDEPQTLPQAIGPAQPRPPAPAPAKPMTLPADLLVTQPGSPGPLSPSATPVREDPAVPQRAPSRPGGPRGSTGEAPGPTFDAPRFDDADMTGEGVVRAEPAALWRRVGAWLADLGFISALVLALLAVAMTVIAPKNMSPLQQLAAVALPGVALGAVLAFAYTTLFAFLWSGRTPGRRLFGIHLVDTSGRAPAPFRALVRALLSLVSFGLFLSGFWLALFDRHGQTLHDKLTRTFVVKLQDA